MKDFDKNEIVPKIPAPVSPRSRARHQKQNKNVSKTDVKEISTDSNKQISKSTYKGETVSRREVELSSSISRSSSKEVSKKSSSKYRTPGTTQRSPRHTSPIKDAEALGSERPEAATAHVASTLDRLVPPVEQAPSPPSVTVSVTSLSSCESPSPLRSPSRYASSTTSISPSQATLSTTLSTPQGNLSSTSPSQIPSSSPSRHSSSSSSSSTHESPIHQQLEEASCSSLPPSYFSANTSAFTSLNQTSVSPFLQQQELSPGHKSTSNLPQSTKSQQCPNQTSCADVLSESSSSTSSSSSSSCLSSCASNYQTSSCSEGLLVGQQENSSANSPRIGAPALPPKGSAAKRPAPRRPSVSYNPICITII